MTARSDTVLARQAEKAASLLCDAVNACRGAGLEVSLTVEGDNPDEKDGPLYVWMTIKREITVP